MISIDRTKNIGILFQPRSGSTVLQYYLSTVLNALNLDELFNFLIPNEKYVNRVVNLFAAHNLGSVPIEVVNSKHSDTNAQTDPWARQLIINRITELSKISVNKIYVNSYFKYAPTFSKDIHQNNIQFIDLTRADILYSIISNFVSKEVGQFHSYSETSVLRIPEDKQFKFPINDFITILETYIAQRIHVKEYFPDAPTLYYEQFQNSPAQIRMLFSGIPKSIVSIPYNKFVGNHKNHIENLKEIEDCYEQFVNQYKEYFPQYFNDLPGITIPSSQGKQPRNLSLNDN